MTPPILVGLTFERSETARRGRDHVPWSTRLDGRRKMTEIEALDRNTWERALTELSGRSVKGECISRSLRHAFHLVQLTPSSLTHVVRCSLNEAKFENLLETEAFGEAALALLGDRLDYSLSHSASAGDVFAKVWYSEYQERCERTRDSAAAALFTAWMGCILSVCRREQEPVQSVIQLSDHRR